MSPEYYNLQQNKKSHRTFSYYLTYKRMLAQEKILKGTFKTLSNKVSLGLVIASGLVTVFVLTIEALYHMGNISTVIAVFCLFLALSVSLVLHNAQHPKRLSAYSCTSVFLKSKGDPSMALLASEVITIIATFILIYISKHLVGVNLTYNQLEFYISSLFVCSFFFTFFISQSRYARNEMRIFIVKPIEAAAGTLTVISWFYLLYINDDIGATLSSALFTLITLIALLIEFYFDLSQKWHRKYFYGNDINIDGIMWLPTFALRKTDFKKFKKHSKDMQWMQENVRTINNERCMRVAAINYSIDSLDQCFYKHQLDEISKKQNKHSKVCRNFFRYILSDNLESALNLMHPKCSFYRHFLPIPNNDSCESMDKIVTYIDKCEKCDWKLGNPEKEGVSTTIKLTTVVQSHKQKSLKFQLNFDELDRIIYIILRKS